MIEKFYIQFFEQRGIDAEHEVVQVFANPFESNLYENGEDDASRGRRTSPQLVREI
jgi:hypothetical protein